MWHSRRAVVRRRAAIRGLGPPCLCGDESPRAGRRGRALRGDDGVRPPTPLHHRPGPRRAADVLRGRTVLDHLQRRALQLPRASRGARSARSIPHRIGHGGRPGGLCGHGDRVPDPAGRDLRLRDLGPIHRRAAPRPGCAGGQAAALPAGRRRPSLRLRAQGADRASRGRPGRRCGGAGGVSRPRLHAHSAHDDPGRVQAPSRPLSPGARRAGLGGALLGSRRSGERLGDERPAGTGADRAPRQRDRQHGEHADGERRPARRLSERRHRLVHDLPLRHSPRLLHAEDLLGRLRRAQLRRVPVLPRGRRHAGERASRAHRSVADSRRARANGLVLRRAPRGHVDRAHLLPGRWRARTREGGALWGRRRRAPGRLRHVPSRTSCMRSTPTFHVGSTAR